MKLIKLNCPTCAGALELPDNLTVAHCIYCGNKILLDQDGIVQERRDLERYIELCKVAVEAKNHNDVIKYCDLILEIDPKNVDAWINKANSNFSLTTGAHNRYNEAMEYLNKASELAPNDGRIGNARVALTQQQAWWYNHLGDQKWQSTLRIYRIYANQSAGGTAHAHSYEQATEAMKLYLLASDYAPNNQTYLENIEKVARMYNLVSWNTKVERKLQLLFALRQKKSAEVELLKLRQELQNARDELARLRTQRGFLIGNKIKAAEKRVDQLSEQISIMEKWVRSHADKG